MIVGFRGYFKKVLTEEQQYMKLWLKKIDEEDISISESTRESIEKFLTIEIDQEARNPEKVIEYLKDIGIAINNENEKRFENPSRSRRKK